MTLSIISQARSVFNYTNAVSCVTCGEYDDGSGYGFMVYLKGDTENGIVVAEYDDAETFHAVKNNFSRSQAMQYSKSSMRMAYWSVRKRSVHQMCVLNRLIKVQQTAMALK